MARRETLETLAGAAAFVFLAPLGLLPSDITEPGFQDFGLWKVYWIRVASFGLPIAGVLIHRLRFCRR
jgi:hypothetical protein